MAYSILPQDWASVEAGLARIFILLGVIIIAPWVALVAYDLILYVIRMAFYDSTNGEETEHAQHGDELGGEAGGRGGNSGDGSSSSSSSSRARSQSRGRSKVRGGEDEKGDGLGGGPSSDAAAARVGGRSAASGGRGVGGPDIEGSAIGVRQRDRGT